MGTVIWWVVVPVFVNTFGSTMVITWFAVDSNFSVKHQWSVRMVLN